MTKFLKTMILIGWMGCAAALLSAAPAEAADVESILAGMEQRYSGKGFSAEFFQESMLRAMQITDTAQGRLVVKRPGKMRWEYTLPDEQTIISNGESLWIHRPADNQVMVGKAPDFFGQGKGAGFLSDIRLVRKSFTVKLAPSDNDAYNRLRLVPIQPNPEIADITLSVHKDSYQVDQIVTHNEYGDETRIVLSQYQFNLEPEESLFNFVIPQGIDVVQLDQQ
jgi:outer membrane lipoprotein carrier protein